MKNENQIWQDMVAAVNAGLADNSVTGFEVRQSSQPIKVTIGQPTIWIERVSSKRYGAQITRPIISGGLLFEQSVYYQEIIFQVSAIKKRLPANTVSTQTAGDVLNILVTYFNGPEGIATLAGKSFSALLISEVREPVATLDSDLYEKTPSFDITVIHKQTQNKTVHHADTTTETVIGI